jgi:hypothetical protein
MFLAVRPKYLTIMLAIIAVPIVLFAVFYAVAWWWLESTRHGKPPELARNVANLQTGWQLRLKETFPVGTPEAVLVSRLRDDGFQVRPDLRSARLNWGQFPCDYSFTAVWAAPNGRVTAVDGEWMQTCI